MGKRKRPGLTEKTLRQIIDRLDALNKDRVAEELHALIPDLLGPKGRGGITKAAGDFTLLEVVQTFKLNYVVMPGEMEPYTWRIEDSKLDFTMTPCLASLVKNYSKNFDRSSEAICRTGLDFILNECLTVLKGNHVDTATEKTTDYRSNTPTPYDDIRVYGEVTFNHRVSQSKTLPTPQRKLSVSGRLDYGIGRIIKHVENAEDQRRRRFQCFLVIVEAKVQFAVTLALPQLLAYLACLRQSRLQNKRTDASVYGVCSDGYQFLFVTITHDGTVKVSKLFDILREGQLSKVLGWLSFMLETTAAMSPNSSPERSGEDEKDKEDLDDPTIDLVDNDYINPPDDDDDDDDDD